VPASYISKEVSLWLYRDQIEGSLLLADAPSGIDRLRGGGRSKAAKLFFFF
jgi:hypothetical protein